MTRLAALSAGFILLGTSVLAQDPVSVGLILQEGDVPPGETDPVSILNAPFVNSLGQVGFVGGLDNNISDRFIWIDDGIVWKSSDALPIVLTGAEGTMGISDDGDFIYSPSTEGDDSVWSGNGLLLARGMQAPGFPDTVLATFNSRPTMAPVGTAYWVAGFNEEGGASTQGRVLYASAEGTPEEIEVVLRSDDEIEGFVIARSSGIDFDYNFSDDGTHHIHMLLMETGSSTNNAFVYVDGALIARESESSGDGDSWENFDLMSINDDGDYVFSGNTDGDIGSDEYIAYNGSIVLREGDLVGNVELTSPAGINGLSINNDGAIAHLWSISGGVELLFFSPDAANPAEGTLLLATGDEIDIDGDDVADATVTDFNASGFLGPGLDLGTSGQVFVEVDLDYGDGELEAILALDLFDSGPQPEPSLLLSGIVEGTRPGGTPKAVELFATEEIEDLSDYAVRIASNGETSWGGALVLEEASIAEGDYLYFASEDPEFAAFFGFASDFTHAFLNFNGDDVVGLFFDANGNGSFEDDEIIDVFGELGVDGSGEPWEYTDGWAYRENSTGPDGETFVLTHWFFSGPGVITGPDATNETTEPPMPVGTYVPWIIGTEGDPQDFHLSKVVPNPAVYSTALVLRLDQTQTVTVRVFDTLGRAVATVDGGRRAADEEIRLELDTSTLAPGMYVIHVEGETFSETRRFTVVR